MAEEEKKEKEEKNPKITKLSEGIGPISPQLFSLNIASTFTQLGLTFDAVSSLPKAGYDVLIDGMNFYKDLLKQKAEDEKQRFLRELKKHRDKVAALRDILDLMKIVVIYGIAEDTFDLERKVIDGVYDKPLLQSDLKFILSMKFGSFEPPSKGT